MCVVVCARREKVEILHYAVTNMRLCVCVHLCLSVSVCVRVWSNLISRVLTSFRSM